MQIPFCGSTYSGRSVNIDCSRSVNFYPEVYQSENNKCNMAMIGTPGTSVFSGNIGGQITPIRGMHSFNGFMYVVVGQYLFSINSTGTAIQLNPGTPMTYSGTVTTAMTRVSMMDNGAKVNSSQIGTYYQLMIVDGTNGWIYNVNTATFSQIVDVNFPPTPQQVEFLDNYFIVTNGTTGYFVSATGDGTTWPNAAVNYCTATPDAIQTVVNHKQQLFFIKTLSTEAHYDAAIATSVGSPFVRQQGAVFDYGTVSPYSIAKGGGTIFMLCTQRTNDGGEVTGVAAITDYAPQTVSTPAIAYKITSSSTNANCFGYCYSEAGHVFYVLTNPDANWTIVYDATTNMWHERSTGATDTFSTPRHIGNFYSSFNGKHYIGSYLNSFIYEMSQAYSTDAGQPIISFRTAQTIVDPEKTNDVFISKLIVDAQTGVGSLPQIITSNNPLIAAYGSVLANGSITAGAYTAGTINPMAYLSWSNDSGNTWSSEYGQSLGTNGQYLARLSWRRIGRSRDRVFKIRISDPVTKILIGATVEASK